MGIFFLGLIDQQGQGIEFVLGFLDSGFEIAGGDENDCSVGLGHDGRTPYFELCLPEVHGGSIVTGSFQFVISERLRGHGETESACWRLLLRAVILGPAWGRWLSGGIPTSCG